MKYILPQKIVSFSGKVENVDNLLTSDRMQLILNEPGLTFVDGKASIILDFGQETYGGLRIQSNTVTDYVRCFVRVRFGESLTECCADINEKNANNHHTIRDLTVELVHSGDLFFGNTGFRFVRLDFLTENCRIGIKNIFASSNIYENENIIYEYKGNDVKIKNIFKVAKHTIDLCAQGDYIWDGIKRDGIVWIGDMYPEMIAMTTLYGRTKIIEDSLNFVINTTPKGGWVNGFPTYSLWYLIILADYATETGAIDFLRTQADAINGIINQMNECVLENGELNYPSYFVDWPTHKTEDEIPGVRAINIIACKKTIDVLKLLGKDTAVVENILDRLMLRPIIVKEKKQIIALKYFALGKISKQEKEMLMDGGIKGFSTFMSYFLFKTVAECVSPAIAVEMLKEYYGAMLDKGATSFWEDFDIDWTENSCRIDEFPKEGQKDIHGDFGKFCYVGFRHSLCHAWSCGIIKFIKEYC